MTVGNRHREWFKANGGYIHPSVGLSSSPSGHFLLVLPDCDTFDAGTTVVSCPHTLTISSVKARDSPILSKLIPDGNVDSIDPTVITRLFLVEQYLLGNKSFWWPYLQTLPQPDDKHAFNTPLWYDDDDFVWLQGTNLGKATVTRRAEWKREFDEATAVLHQFSGHCSWTWQTYLWSATITSSRSFPGSALPNKGIDSAVLIPGLDLLNHSPSAKVVWDWGRNDCTIRVDESLTGGSEIFNNYGPKGNEELLMGYGFCIPNNMADTFGLGFSKAVSRHIQATKSARSGPPRGGESHNEDNMLSNDPSQVAEQHWVRLKPLILLEDKANERQFQHQFSPYFLEQFSIALENKREHVQHNTGSLPVAYGISQTEVQCTAVTGLSRNRFHVLNALIMLLERSRTEIRQHDALLLGRKPANRRQQDAAIYRSHQLTILDGTLAELNYTLNIIMGDEIFNGVVRLEHILTLGPKLLVKDLRSLLHVALGTRDAKKIKERRGDECAFALWLCGLWILHRAGDVNDETALGSRLVSWLDFLDQTYGLPSPTLDEHPTNSGLGPLNNGMAFDPASDSVVAASYMEAIDATVEKHPRSLFKSKGNVTVPLLLWCLEVVRDEGVRIPQPSGTAIEQEDEYTLFLENGTQMP
ncbi:MAG: hypothetical protein Q9163_001822 [Psora crenata]